MNSGVEAGETAVKLARKWGYEKKELKEFCKNNFSRGEFLGKNLSSYFEFY